jgi:riboflavin synthase
MFTGIIEGMGTIEGIHSGGRGARLAIAADFKLEGTRIGDSIAVNGACLTAVSLRDRRFTADVSPETNQRTILGAVSIGDRVNLERAMRLSDRLDGHLVSGHVDGIGRLERREISDNAVLLTFSAPPELLRYMIVKGSVAVDGVSLTINHCDQSGFQVGIIPHTAGLTTVGSKHAGQAVNIETDIIGKYVERFIKRNKEAVPAAATGIDLEFLAKSGFLES